MMGRHLKDGYDLIINVGVCGAFDKNLELGELVHITEDVLSEMGAEDGGEFLKYDQLNILGQHVFSENSKDSYLMIDSLRKLFGCCPGAGCCERASFACLNDSSSRDKGLGRFEVCGELCSDHFLDFFE